MLLLLRRKFRRRVKDERRGFVLVEMCLVDPTRASDKAELRHEALIAMTVRAENIERVLAWSRGEVKDTTSRCPAGCCCFAIA